MCQTKEKSGVSSSIRSSKMCSMRLAFLVVGCRPPTERDLTLPCSLLPALAPQPKGGASNGAPGRSAVSQPIPHLPASPTHRVDGLLLAGALSSPPSTLSEKPEYLFFSPQTFQCYFMNIHNKYFGKIFSALCVDVFPELFWIFPNFDIS